MPDNTKPPAPPEFGHGMLLRDWFAGQALIGILSGVLGEMLDKAPPYVYAQDAYNMADAMLHARSATKSETDHAG